jgi:hypothetical protein
LHLERQQTFVGEDCSRYQLQISLKPSKTLANVYDFLTVQSDFISLDLFKDEIIAINNNNSVSFIPLNEDVGGQIAFLVGMNNV